MGRFLCNPPTVITTTCGNFKGTFTGSITGSCITSDTICSSRYNLVNTNRSCTRTVDNYTVIYCCKCWLHGGTLSACFLIPFCDYEDIDFNIIFHSGAGGVPYLAFLDSRLCTWTSDTLYRFAMPDVISQTTCCCPYISGCASNYTGYKGTFFRSADPRGVGPSPSCEALGFAFSTYGYDSCCFNNVTLNGAYIRGLMESCSSTCACSLFWSRARGIYISFGGTATVGCTGSYFIAGRPRD